MKTKPNCTAYLALALSLAAPFTASGVKPKTKLSGPGVTVYVRQDIPIEPDHLRAQQVASEIFATIGVPVTFRNGSPPNSASESPFLIELQLDSRVPAQFHPGALAYAMPFANSGTRIHILCDRVRTSLPDGGKGASLGYVMAHEIAHVLQSTNRHSDEGVMKAHWRQPDYSLMMIGALAFDPTDAEIIRERLANATTLSIRAAR